MVIKLSGGVKKIIRRANDDDEVENEKMILERDISHISYELIQTMYQTRLSEERRATV